jgi:hypothetical protein
MQRKNPEPSIIKQLSFRTTRPMVSAVRSAAFARECSMQTWLLDAIEQKLLAEGRLPKQEAAA